MKFIFNWIYYFVIKSWLDYWIHESFNDPRNLSLIVRFGIQYYKSKSITSRHIINQLSFVNEFNYFLIFLQIQTLAKINNNSLELTIKNLNLYQNKSRIDIGLFGYYILKHAVQMDDYNAMCNIIGCTFDQFKKIDKIDLMFRPHFDYHFCLEFNIRPSNDTLFMNKFCESSIGNPF